MLLEEREWGDLSKDRRVLPEGWRVPAIAKPTVEPLDRFQFSIVVVMAGHLLERMPLGGRERGLNPHLAPSCFSPAPTGLVYNVLPMSLFKRLKPLD